MITAKNQQFIYSQTWFFLFCLTGLATYIANDLHYIAAMVEADQSFISIIIMIIFLAASGHAVWHVLATERSIEACMRLLAGEALKGPTSSKADNPIKRPEEAIANYVATLQACHGAASAEIADREAALALDIYADRLRNPTATGWYLVDLLIRLGLIGTIVGFIIVLGVLASGPVPTGDNIQALLISMSGGMGTALYTTLAGLICASLLGMQHMILGRCVEQLIALLIELKAQTRKMQAG